MPTIDWNETVPADTESAGLGDDRIRSLKTSIRIGLDGEHVWPSGGGDAGVHRLGSARAYVATQSLASSSGTDGRLLHASDTSNLFGVGSAGTVFLGGPMVLSAGSFPGGLPQRHYWAVEFGTATTASNGSVDITFPNSGFSGQPFVQVTGAPTGGIASYTAVTAVGFRAKLYDPGVGVGFADDLQWLSIGTRVL